MAHFDFFGPTLATLLTKAWVKIYLYAMSENIKFNDRSALAAYILLRRCACAAGPKPFQLSSLPSRQPAIQLSLALPISNGQLFQDLPEAPA